MAPDSAFAMRDDPGRDGIRGSTADRVFFPSFEVEDVSTTGASIRTLRKGSGPPLLLLHGSPQTHLIWHKIADRLAERFAVAAHDRCARAAHRLCLDRPGAVRRVCFMHIVPTLRMYRDTSKAFATALVLWGAKSVTGTLWNVLDVWREHAHAPVEGRALDCGHFLAEERPDEVLGELLRFFDREE